MFQSVFDSLGRIEQLQTSIYLDLREIELEHGGPSRRVGTNGLDEIGRRDGLPTHFNPRTSSSGSTRSAPKLLKKKSQVRISTNIDVVTHASPELHERDGLPLVDERDNENEELQIDEDACALVQNQGVPQPSFSTQDKFQRVPHPALDESMPLEVDNCAYWSNEKLDSTEDTAWDSSGQEDANVYASSSMETGATASTVPYRRSGASEELPTAHCVFELWAVWSESSPRATRVTRGTRSRSTMIADNKTPLERRYSNIRAGDEIKSSTCLHWIVARPSAPRRLLWDILSIFALAYDVVVIPLVPFDLPETEFTKIMDLMTMLFWQLDMFFSFTTGFYDMGVLEMRLSRIAERYMRSWFPTDVAVLSIDYFLLLFAREDGPFGFLLFARIGKALRIFRVLRMFRLLRLLKAVAILADLSDSIFSEATLTFCRVVLLMLAIVLVNHFLACGWYAVGAHAVGENVYTWVKELEEMEDAEISFSWLYTSSLHWSITQFTPASMEIHPRNPIERCYALCVILFGLVAFSSFVSSITTSMTHLRIVNMEHAKQHEQIRRYITENRVSVDLGSRMQAFLRQIRRTENQRKRVHEYDIPSFGSLPETLRFELHCQIFVPMLTPHHFFSHMNKFDETGLLNICHSTMSEQSLSHGQTLFTTGDPCVKMFCVLSGHMDYFYLLDSEPTVNIGTAEFLSEMALWIQWEHQGRLVATVNSEVVGVDSKQFRAVASRTESFPSCKLYAQHYARCIRESSMPCETTILGLREAESAFGNLIGNHNRSKFASLKSMSSRVGKLGSLNSTEGKLSLTGVLSIFNRSSADTRQS